MPKPRGTLNSLFNSISKLPTIGLDIFICMAYHGLEMNLSTTPSLPFPTSTSKPALPCHASLPPPPPPHPFLVLRVLQALGCETQGTYSHHASNRWMIDRYAAFSVVVSKLSHKKSLLVLNKLIKS